MPQAAAKRVMTHSAGLNDPLNQRPDLSSWPVFRRDRTCVETPMGLCDADGKDDSLASAASFACVPEGVFERRLTDRCAGNFPAVDQHYRDLEEVARL